MAFTYFAPGSKIAIENTLSIGLAMDSWDGHCDWGYLGRLTGNIAFGIATSAIVGNFFQGSTSISQFKPLEPGTGLLFKEKQVAPIAGLKSFSYIGVFSTFNNLDDLKNLFIGKTLANAEADLVRSGWTEFGKRTKSKVCFHKQNGQSHYYATWNGSEMTHSINNYPTYYWKLCLGKVNANQKNTRRVSDAPNFKAN